MAPEFDAYVMVDWSASTAPKIGPDSIWIAALERDQAGGSLRSRLWNPPTRQQAFSDLADLFSDLIARGRTTLAGFDFAFGYPAGFAQRVAGKTADDGKPANWQSVWKSLTARVRDDVTNVNNRFDVATELNRLISGGDFPFWGCPPAFVSPNLSPHRPQGYGGSGLAEYRIAERRRQGPKSPWKLSYPGSVGGQTLLGIAFLERLRKHPWLDGRAKVWPFETGLRPFARAEAAGTIVLAEVYPSMIPSHPSSTDVKDSVQVDTIARHFAKLDENGRLAPLFAGPADLRPEDRSAIEREEGWILGIETAGGTQAPAVNGTTAPYDYLRDPAAIYRRSFELIVENANLSDLPTDLAPVAVRLIHASGDPSLVANLAWSPGAVAAGRSALAAGAPILADSMMVASGIIRSHLWRDNPVICTLALPGVAETATAQGVTRSMVAVDRWAPHLAGAIVAIGNAPTALFRLLEILDAGTPKPALILGFPVGFVGAAESKEALIAHAAGVPYIALRGRQGGSALAAAAVNALAGDSLSGGRG